MKHKLQFLKKGSGATLLGLSLVVLGFLLMLCIMNNFNFFLGGVSVQTRTDAIADGTAVAANDGTNVPNWYLATEAKNELVRKNNEVTGSDGLQILSATIDKNDFIDDKIMSLSVNARIKFWNSDYYTFSSYYNNHSYVKLTAKNRTLMLTSHTNEMNELFPADYHYVTYPSITYDPEIDGDLTPYLYFQIVQQFEVNLTERYQADADLARDDIYIWDVTRALNCELPYFYSALNGKSWTVNNEGRMYDDGTYVQKMYSISELTNGYYDFATAYLPEAFNSNAHCANPYSDYSNWHILDSTDLDAIQDKANDGCPTILLFANGKCEIVLPEIATRSNDNTGLYVSYAASVYSTSGAYYVNHNTTNESATYQTPYGSFIALWYEY